MPLSSYISKFSHLRTDRTAHWTESTLGQAPHKPILLLAVLDLLAQGRLTHNLIEITPELGELFAAYWSKVIPPERRGNLALPFFHLRSSGFWHLLPQPGKEDALQAIRQVDRLGQLQRLVLGACLDDELFQLLQDPQARNALRITLIGTYFAQEYQAALLELGEINLQAYLYSQQLVEQARHKVGEAPSAEETYQPAVRDHGFRRAVVRIYEHRCALCGVRMLTADGRSAVDAAHIVPWSLSHEDDLHNGLALCRLCHWTFDAGLVGVSNHYHLLLSGELRLHPNLPGHLLTLEQRPILGPQEEGLWPALEALGWHRTHVFRRE